MGRPRSRHIEMIESRAKGFSTLGCVRVMNAHKPDELESSRRLGTCKLAKFRQTGTRASDSHHMAP
jgi:hypothetical protein